MTAQVKTMIRVDACEDIKNLTNEQYKKFIRSRRVVVWKGRKIERRHSIHVLLRDNPFRDFEKSEEEHYIKEIEE